MKKALIPATIIILIAVMYCSCSKKKTYIEFDIPYSFDIVVPTYTAANETFTFNTWDMKTDMNTALEAQGTNANLIGEMKYTKFDVAIKTPSASSVSFIKQMKFYIHALNQPQQQVAFKYNEKGDTIPPGTKSTSFDINETNLKNRFVENVVYFKVNLMEAYIVPQTTLTISQNIHVKGISE